LSSQAVIPLVFLRFRGNFMLIKGGITGGVDEKRCGGSGGEWVPGRPRTGAGTVLGQFLN
jgi:hypothetical protein